ncbi:carboxypeptidase regulatory-like domain-containing protein [Actinomycetota bacterium]
MAAPRGLLRCESTEEAGFTIIEVVIAAAILAIAIVLTVTPLVTSMRSLDRSKDVTIAESIAQGRIEQIRALEFSDIGHPGSSPDGILARSETETVEGASFVIETTVEFVGAASGLDIVAQGGDGVEGRYDIGVNYKHVHVVVTAVGSGADAVTMDTLIAPPTIGGLDDIAVIEVTLDRHEPFDPSIDPEPAVRISGPWIYDSAGGATTHFFTDVFVGTYAVSLVTSRGWLVHPDSIDSGATGVDAVLGTKTQRTIRIFQPVSLDVVVLDDDTGLPITNAVLAATDLAYGPPTTNSAGDYSFTGLVPDRYSVLAVVSGYQSESVEVDVPGTGGGSGATATVRMSPQAFVGVDYDFFVDHDGANGYHISGATVRVTHPSFGVFTGTTDETGHTVIELPASTTGFSVTVTAPWGQDPATAALTTGTSPGSGAFSLTPPPITDVFPLRNGAVGPAGFFEYKVGSGSWVRLPANDEGKATFVVPEDDGTIVEMRTYCSAADYPGSPAETRSEPLDGGDFRWNAKASC